MTKYNTLLFDLDGTLLDTLGDLTDGVNHVLSRFSFKNRTEQEIKSFIGNGIPTLLRRSLPADANDLIHTQAMSYFSEYYGQNMKNKTKPYDGVYELLLSLKQQGFNVGVVSNKKDSAVKELCSFFFNPVFGGENNRFALGATGEHNRKPNPQLVFDAMNSFGSNKESTVMIGDSDVDIMTAKNAGIDIICVGWGFRDAEFLAGKGALNIANNAEELWILLTSHA